MAKLTFSVDDATVAKLRQAAEDLGKPQSMVVREAVTEYHARHTPLTAEERLRKLAIMDRIMRRPAGKPGTAAGEVSEIRRARRQGGRRTRVD
jgi:hypothetical protein